MKGFFFTQDNSYNYPLETGTLSANTWTKITKTIPGNSNLVFNNDNGVGIVISLGVYGPFFSSANPSVNQWGAYSSATLTNPSETTWWTTNGATLEFTGVQLEVSDHATSFEHKSYAQELDLCRRYCQVYKSVGNYSRFATTIAQSSSSIRSIFYLKKQLRAVPTFSYSGNFQCANATNFNIANMGLESSSTSLDVVVLNQGGMSVTAQSAFFLAGNNDTSAQITFDSEL